MGRHSLDGLARAERRIERQHNLQGWCQCERLMTTEPHLGGQQPRELIPISLIQELHVALTDEPVPSLGSATANGDANNLASPFADKSACIFGIFTYYVVTNCQLKPHRDARGHSPPTRSRPVKKNSFATRRIEDWSGESPETQTRNHVANLVGVWGDAGGATQCARCDG